MPIRLLRPIPLLCFIIAWEMYVHGDAERAFFFGSPAKVLSYVIDKTIDGSLPVDFAVTFLEVVAGFILGNLIGIVVGLALWHSKIAFEIARPYILALGSAPIFALAPLLVIWFGTGIISKIIIVTLSTVFVALLQAYTGADQVSNDYLSLMKTFRATKGQVFRKIVAPSAIVWVVSAFRLNVGFSILGAFIGEFISSSAGIGHLILVASGLFDISLVLCGVLLLILIALLLNYAVGIVEGPIKRLVVGWL